jgi:glycosyltransferase involved in cell wall biosynthesis
MNPEKRTKVVMLGLFLGNTEIGLTDSLASQSLIDFTFISVCWYGSHPPGDPSKSNNFRVRYQRSYNHFYADNPAESEALIAAADLLIVGASDPAKFKRYIGKKPVCFFRERYYKKPAKVSRFLHDWLSMLFQFRLHNPRKLFLLTSSSFSYGDFSRFGCFKNRAFSLPYSVPDNPKDSQQLQSKFSSSHINICFVGNLQTEKRPFWLLDYADHLRAKFKDFTLYIVGHNGLEEQLKRSCDQLGLNSNVVFPGPEVRDYLDRSQIYITTGGRDEGFNCGLYSAMQSCCACVSSCENGSGFELVHHRKTGLLYTTKDDFFKLMDELVFDPKLQKELGIAGHDYYESTWKPSLFGERFQTVLPVLLTGGTSKDIAYRDGPMAPSYLIKYWGKKPHSHKYEFEKIRNNPEAYR